MSNNIHVFRKRNFPKLLLEINGIFYTLLKILKGAKFLLFSICISTVLSCLKEQRSKVMIAIALIHLFFFFFYFFWGGG